MKTWKHINLEQRKTISSCISHNYKLINILLLKINMKYDMLNAEVKRMRRKKLYVVIIIILCFVCNIDTVNADSPSCYAMLNNYNNNVAVGEEFIYNIGTMGAASNTYINSLYYTIAYDPNDLEVVEINGTTAGSYNGWNVYSNHNTNTGLRVNFITVEAKTEDVSKMYNSIVYDNFVKIAYVKFRVKSDAKSSTTIEIKNNDSYYTHIFEDELQTKTAEKRECYNTNTTAVSIYTKNSDTTLSSLSVNNGKLDTEFNNQKTSYSVTVDNEVNTIQIDGTCTGKNCKVSGIGLKELEVGENQFAVTVTAENGDTQKYTINVIRREKEEVFLKSLIVEGVELLPSFDSSINNYVVIVPYETNVLNIKYIANDDANIVEIIGNKNLKVGKNGVSLMITNEKNTVTTKYNLTVLKEEKIEEVVEDKDYSMYYIIGLIALGVISVGELIFILKKTNQKNNENHMS